MPKYRNALPQLAGDKLFLTDGGLETDLIFHHGIDLPLFASITLYKDGAEPHILRDYFTPYIETAKAGGSGIVLETATWRASPDWLAQLGFDKSAYEAVRHPSTR